MVRVALIGYGNIGKAVYRGVMATDDLELVAVVESNLAAIDSLQGVQKLDSIDQLPPVDVAILTVPSRAVPQLAAALLAKGISTVDGYDIHSEILQLRQTLSPIAQQNNAASIISAGWDPGSDSVIRTLFEAMAPQGISYTDFGPGMSMGHSVAAKAIPGVKEALSMTIPLGTGLHRRMVYLELESGADEATVRRALLSDSYFAHDETHMVVVPSVKQLLDKGHGVVISRKGVASGSDNQLLKFSMTIDNPALTGQILVSSARAVVKQPPGCYTLIELPLIDLLPGTRDQAIARLV